MTTVVLSRHPFQNLTEMNNRRPELRRGKRSALYDEQDGDFLFTRGPKRAKTTTLAPHEPEPVPAQPPRRPGRPPKGAATSKKRSASPPLPPATEQSTIVADDFRRATAAPARAIRRSQRLSNTGEDASTPAAPGTAHDGDQSVVRKTKARRKAQDLSGTGEGLAELGSVAEERPQQKRRGRPPRSARALAPASATTATAGGKDGIGGRDINHGGDPSPDESHDENEDAINDSASPDPPQVISLPISDTPIMERNKEFRRKGGPGGGAGSRASGRRSSFGSRGRRASSLMESGHSALPHRELTSSEFYKHINADELEPRRMRQLLMWCGDRALSEKPPHGVHGSSAVLGARAIQDQLLKALSTQSEFSDWFRREEEPQKPVVSKPNPRNIEHDAKIAELEIRVQRLREEKKAWESSFKPQPTVPPLFPPDDDPSRPALPEEALLEADEAAILVSLLSDPASSFANVRKRTRSRLQAVRTAVELSVDRLADSAHRLERRVAAAAREADTVLALSADRLKEREDKEKAAAGTKELAPMEILRSLSRLLPEGGNG